MSLCNLSRDKRQCHAIVAITLARWLRTIVKDVALVPAAARAMVFGARVDQFKVSRCADVVGDRRIKARPARAAFVFGF